MRSHLIMRLYCSVCGCGLNLVYEGDEKTKARDKFSYTDKPPTGADCRYISPIQVEPCRSCERPVDRLKQVADEIKDSLKDLTLDTTRN